MTAYESYWGYWHGNHNTVHRSPKIAEIRCKMTMERKNSVNLLGIKVISMWEDTWKYEMNNSTDDYRDEINSTC